MQTVCAMAHILDWSDLQHVLAVAERGSVAAAGRALGVHHATVLRRIAAFEQRLGVLLFDRTPAGYALTATGEELVAAVRTMDETATDLERRLAGQDLRLTGTVRLATTDTLAVTLLGPALAALGAQHPGVALEVTTTNAMVSLTRRDADVALRPTRSPQGSLFGVRVAEIAFSIYAAPSYLERHPARRELARHAWVGLDASLAGTTIARWMARSLREVKPVAVVDSLVALRALAVAGLGVAALPCYLADGAPGLTRIRGLEPELATELWLLTHADLKGTARVRAVMASLGASLAAQRDLVEGRRPRK